MKQTLSIKRVVLLFLLACSGLGGLKAQTQITTAYTNGPGYLLFTTGAPTYVTFTVKNNNCYPIAITDFSIFHASSQTYGSINLSNNGAIYTVLRGIPDNNVTGFPNLTSTAWTIVGTSSPITTASNGIVPVLGGVSDVIVPGNEVRYAIVSNDSIVVRNTPGTSPATQIVPSPISFTVNGVTLQSVDATSTQSKIIMGQYPSSPTGAYITFPPPTFQAQYNQYGFDGGITFKRGGPIAAVTNNNACDQSGDSIVLSATLPAGPTCIDPTTATFQWTGPAGSFNGPVWKIPAILANAGQYLCTYTVPGTPPETSAPTAVNVAVTPLPPAPIITAKTAYCIGEPFEPVVVDGQNITWYLNPTGGTGTFLPPYVNTNLPGSYTWYASQTVNNCEGPRTGVTITVAPIPPRPVVTTPVVYCENAPATPLTANATGQLKWYVDPVGGLGSVNPPIPGTSVQDTLTWYVSQTVDACEGPRSKIQVIVTFKPNGLILVSDTPWICQHEELTFTYYGSAVPSTGINWKVPDGATKISGGVLPLEPIRIRFDSAGLKKVLMQANNLSCYSDVYTQYVTVKPIPTAKIGAPSDVCLNDDQLIYAYDYSPTIDSFNWKWDGAKTTHFATDQGPYGIYWTTPGKKVIKIDLVDELCHGEAVDTVIVRELPDARIKGFLFNDANNNFDEFDFKKGAICSSDSLRLEPNTIVVSSKYEWSPARFFDNYSDIPVTYGRIDFSGIVGLKVTDEIGCIGMDSVAITTKPCCEIAFPNAFSPNGDGHNDLFRAITPGYHNTRTFQVLNRWGQVVYESVDEHRGWDGTMNGEPLDLGTYYYHINFKCDGKYTDQKGEFILVR